MSDSVVLCEGFHDRAFWAGWLVRLGCEDLGGSLGSLPAKAMEAKGHFWFRRPGGDFVRVIPCRGYDNVLPTARRYVETRTQDVLRHLVVCVDPDVTGEDVRTGLRFDDLFRIVSGVAAGAVRTSDGDIALDGGRTRVSLVRWECDGDVRGVPGQQCLERLVSAAIVAAYPTRGPAVQAWLDGRPDAPGIIPKSFAWSHMAGWYPGRGCENFFRAVWEDERILGELKTRLQASGAWRVAEALVG